MKLNDYINIHNTEIDLRESAYSYYAPILKGLIGKKIMRVDGTKTKLFSARMHYAYAITNYDKTLLELRCRRPIKISNGGITYAETSFHIGTLNGGKLVEVLDFEVIEKLDFNEEQAKYEATKKVFQEAFKGLDELCYSTRQAVKGDFYRL